MLPGVATPLYLPIFGCVGRGKLPGEWAAESKLDGWRAIVTVDPMGTLDEAEEA